MASRKNGNPVLPVRRHGRAADRRSRRADGGCWGNISDAMLRRLEQSDPDFPPAFSLTHRAQSGCPCASSRSRTREAYVAAKEGGSNQPEIAAPGCHAGRRSTAAAHSQAQAHSVR